MTTHGSYGQDAQDETAEFVRSLALSSAKLWEALFERIHRLEAAQADLYHFLTSIQSALPAGIQSARDPVIERGEHAGTPSLPPSPASDAAVLGRLEQAAEAAAEWAAPFGGRTSEPSPDDAIPAAVGWTAPVNPTPVADNAPSAQATEPESWPSFADEAEFRSSAEAPRHAAAPFSEELGGPAFRPPPPPTAVSSVESDPFDFGAPVPPPPGFASTPPPPPPPGFASSSTEQVDVPSSATPTETFSIGVPPPPPGFASFEPAPEPAVAEPQEAWSTATETTSAPPPPPGFASFEPVLQVANYSQDAAVTAPGAQMQPEMSAPPPPPGFAAAGEPTATAGYAAPPPPPGFAAAGEPTATAGYAAPPPPPGFAAAGEPTATAGYAVPPPPPGFAAAGEPTATAGYAVPPPPPGFAAAGESTSADYAVNGAPRADAEEAHRHFERSDNGENPPPITPDFFARAGRRRH